MGLLISVIAERTFIPRVTLLLIFGIVIGNQGLNLIPIVFTDYFVVIADITLLMVGFLIGGKLSLSSLKESAGVILSISISAAILTTISVCIGLMWIGLSFEVSLLLGCISSATAPAAIYDVINELGHQNKFSHLLLSIVALDDIWALIIFAVGMAIVNSLNGLTGEIHFLWHPFKEIFGAIIVGAALGFPAAYLTGRIKKGQPLLSEGIGIVFICGGLCLWLGVSYLIAAIVMGFIVTNIAKHHEYRFHEIEGVESLFMVVFFVLAGSSLDLSMMINVGWITLIYIITRIFGKYVGALIGCQVFYVDSTTKNWMGLAMLPQAGVAIGMGLIASNHFPQHRQTLLTIIISSTVFFEIIGPIFTRLALNKFKSQSKT
jgi:Kef-type K+ transport system membrane component KefB